MSVTNYVYVVQAIGRGGEVLHTTYVNARPGRECSPAVRDWMRIFVDERRFRLRARIADPERDLGCVPANSPPDDDAHKQRSN